MLAAAVRWISSLFFCLNRNNSCSSPRTPSPCQMFREPDLERYAEVNLPLQPLSRYNGQQ